METWNHFHRRAVIKSSALGILALSLPDLVRSYADKSVYQKQIISDDIPGHYPYVDPQLVAEVVGKSHFDLETVRKLVDARSELAHAVHDWRFGDFESALGAASHVGRRDIAFYLMSKGASPNIFTFTMLGSHEIVRSIVAAAPGIQRFTGPHGISLLRHAYAGEEMKESMTTLELDNVKRTIEFLESLGDAGGNTYLEVSPEEQEKYIGDYQYGTGEKEGFSVKVNSRKMLSLGPVGQSGGTLYKTGEHTFTYNGTPSVTIYFDMQNGAAISLTVSEPGLSVIAQKVS